MIIFYPLKILSCFHRPQGVIYARSVPAPDVNPEAASHRDMEADGKVPIMERKLMNRVPKYAAPAVDPPKIQEGALVPVDEIEITDVKGDYGPQYQIDGKVRGTDFNARAWIKKYDNPTVKTKIVKLCMLIEDELNTEYESIDEALYDLTNKIGCLHFQCSGHRTSEDGPDYPKFSVNTGSFPAYDQPARLNNTKARIEALRSSILAVKPNITETALNDLISEEVAKAGGLLTQEAATYLVSRNLGVELTA